MKRALCGLLAAWMAFAPAVAESRVLIVSGDNRIGFFSYTNLGDEYSSSNNCQSIRDQYDIIQSIFSALGMKQGVDYDVMNQYTYDCRTQYLRTGVVTYNAPIPPATTNPGAYTVTYDAIIHVNAWGVPSSVQRKFYRPDSLAACQDTNNFNRVPQLFIDQNGGFNTTAACSTGFFGDLTALGQAGEVKYSPQNNALRFRTNTNKITALQAPGKLVGGYRVLVAANSGACRIYNDAMGQFGGTSTPATWPDSLLANTNGADSAIVWVKLFNNVRNSAGVGPKPVIFTHTNDYSSTSLDIPSLLVALNYLDSLTAGKVLNGRTFQFAVNVRGLTSRGAAKGYPLSTGGMVDADSVNTYASLDSLNTLGVPMTFTINPDSLASYPRDWTALTSKVQNYSVAPFVRTGMDTTALGSSDRTSPYRLVDVFGVARNRAAYGDSAAHTYTGTFGADSSINAQVRRMFAFCDSLAPGRVDHVIIPPNDDWTAKNYTQFGSDSLHWVLVRNGVRAIVTNRNMGQVNMQGRSMTTRQGDAWHSHQRALSLQPGATINILATAPLDSGSTRFDNNSLNTNAGCRTVTFLDDFWRCLVGARIGGAQGSHSQNDSLNTRLPVLTVHMADLGSGTRSDASTRPTRPGWHLIKDIVNASKVVNLFNTRPLVVVTRTENVTP